MRRFFLTDYDRGMAFGFAVCFFTADKITWSRTIATLLLWGFLQLMFAASNWVFKK